MIRLSGLSSIDHHIPMGRCGEMSQVFFLGELAEGSWEDVCFLLFIYGQWWNELFSGQGNNTEKQFIILIFCFLLGLKHLLVHSPVVVLKKNMVSSEIALQYCVKCLRKQIFFFLFEQSDSEIVRVRENRNRLNGQVTCDHQEKEVSIWLECSLEDQIMVVANQVWKISLGVTEWEVTVEIFVNAYSSKSQLTKSKRCYFRNPLN